MRKMDLLKVPLGAVFVTGALWAGGAFAQGDPRIAEQHYFQQLDTNGDGQIDRQEANGITGVPNIFDDFAGDDDMLSRREYSRAVEYVQDLGYEPTTAAPAWSG